MHGPESLFLHSSSVVRMDIVKEHLVSWDELLRSKPEDTVKFSGPLRPVLVQDVLPASKVSDPLRGAKVALAALQFLFSLLALGDISQRARHADRRPVLVALSLPTSNTGTVLAIGATNAELFVELHAALQVSCYGVYNSLSVLWV